MMKTEFSRPIPIDTIDRNGVQKSIEATQGECDALAKRFDLHDIASLSADLTVEISSMIFHVTGQLHATVSQISVVSGEPIETPVTHDIDAYYADRSRIASFAEAKKAKEVQENDEHEIKDEKDDPELITDGVLDLGEITAQFLGLALDDYPRAENETFGDYIEVAPEDAKPNPFAELAKLKDNQ